MQLRQLLRKISPLPWNINTVSAYRIIIRSKATPVAAIDETRHSAGQATREADAAYIAHVASVAPQVLELLHLALTSNVDESQIIQNAYNLLNEIETKKEAGAS